MSVHIDTATSGMVAQVPSRRRSLVAVLLVVGSLLWVVEELFTHHEETSLTAGILSVPFQAAYVVIVVWLTRACTRWALPSGIALGVSLVGLAMVHGLEYAEFAQVRAGADKEALDRALESTSTAPAIIVVAMFLGGAMLGTILLAVTLWRSAWVPRIATLLIVAELVLDLVLDLNLAGLTAGLLSSTCVAVAVLRTGAAIPVRESTMALP
jgi:hypothetical protein